MSYVSLVFMKQLERGNSNRLQLSYWSVEFHEESVVPPRLARIDYHIIRVAIDVYSGTRV